MDAALKISSIDVDATMFVTLLGWLGADDQTTFGALMQLLPCFTFRQASRAQEPVEQQGCRRNCCPGSVTK